MSQAVKPEEKEAWTAAAAAATSSLQVMQFKLIQLHSMMDPSAGGVHASLRRQVAACLARAGAGSSSQLVDAAADFDLLKQALKHWHSQLEWAWTERPATAAASAAAEAEALKQRLQRRDNTIRHLKQQLQQQGQQIGQPRTHADKQN